MLIYDCDVCLCLLVAPQSILEYNGSGIVAMCGKNCVAIASDMRFGIQQQTITDDMHKVFMMHDKCFIGLSGLISDMQTLHAKLRMRCNMYELKEDRKIGAKTFGQMVSTLLYEHRFGPFFVEPVVAGLEERTVKDGKETRKEWVPYITAMDLIGAGVDTDDFVVAGTCTEQLYGCCEAMYRPDMEKEDLFETISQVLLASVDRDCLAGWGAEVKIITPEGVETRQLKSRKD